MRFVLIVSSVIIQPLANAQDAATTEVDGLKVAVAKTTYAKCARCWHHCSDIGTHANHPELCGRCVDNVDGGGEVRRYA